MAWRWNLSLMMIGLMRAHTPYRVMDDTKQMHIYEWNGYQHARFWSRRETVIGGKSDRRRSGASLLRSPGSRV